MDEAHFWAADGSETPQPHHFAKSVFADGSAKPIAKGLESRAAEAMVDMVDSVVHCVMTGAVPSHLRQNAATAEMMRM